MACVIGLGYVGLPMAIAIANAKLKHKFHYKVFGFDKDLKKSEILQQSIISKKLPIETTDKKLKQKFFTSSHKNKINLINDIKDVNKMDIIVLSVGFDFIDNKNSLKNLIKLINSITLNIKNGALLLIETTLPPGTFEKILVPKIKQNLKKRRARLENIYLGYSFERIMPGSKYYDSIVNNYRCYSGLNISSKKAVRSFLKSIINYKKYPLKELDTITECEAAKILENSYRAINIALIDEWVKYAKTINVDLLTIIKSIKIRSTHSNIMMPGLGVGGYCLPKDGLFAAKSAKMIFKKKLNFPFINLASEINNKMPLTSLNLVESETKRLKGEKILIMGSAYRPDVDDTRNSPSLILVKELKKKGAIVSTHDPMIINKKIPKFGQYNLVLFCVKHKKYKNISIKNFSKKTTYFDLNNVLNEKIISFMKKNRYKLNILGRYSE